MTSGGAAPDWENDERDGALFRFWIRAASYPGGFPMEMARAISNCTTPADYRKALSELAERKRINLPPPPPYEEIAKERSELRAALKTVVDGVVSGKIGSISDDDIARFCRLAGVVH